MLYLQQKFDAIMYGGVFTGYSGNSTFLYTSTNTTGDLDTNFDSNEFQTHLQVSGVQSRVLDIAEQSDGKLILVGLFTGYGGTQVSNIVRTSNLGVLDNTFQQGSGFAGSFSRICNVVAINSNDEIFVGGDYTEYSGISSNSLIKLSANGTKDNTFTSYFSAGANVLDIKIQNNKLLIGGQFVTYNSTNVRSIIRVNANGTIDSSFSGRCDFPTSVARVNSIAIQPDGKIVVVGSFDTVNTFFTRHNIVRFTSGGTIDETFVSQSWASGYTQEELSKVLLLSDGKFLVGGLKNINKLFYLDSNGSLLQTMTTSGGSINDIIKVENGSGRYLVGGSFTSITINNIVYPANNIIGIESIEGSLNTM